MNVKLNWRQSLFVVGLLSITIPIAIWMHTPQPMRSDTFDWLFGFTAFFASLMIIPVASRLWWLPREWSKSERREARWEIVGQIGWGLAWCVLVVIVTWISYDRFSIQVGDDLFFIMPGAGALALALSPIFNALKDR